MFELIQLFLLLTWMKTSVEVCYNTNYIYTCDNFRSIDGKMVNVVIEMPYMRFLQDFESTKNLENIRITSSIQQFAYGAFNNVENLDYLYLDNNIIGSIRSYEFNNSKLTTLVLKNNRICSVNGKIGNLPKLKHLSLQRNLLKTFNAQCISNPTPMEDLDLSQNQLIYLNNGSFQGLTNLYNLDLSSNQISHIESNTLFATGTINLDHNIMEDLYGDEFKDSVFPEELFIASNSLMYLTKIMLKAARGVRLRIGGNPWSCKCLDLILMENLPLDSCDLNHYFNGKAPVCVVASTKYCQYEYNRTLYHMYKAKLGDFKLVC